MASNYTSNYGLCQWTASDKVLRTEFNADNVKIDAAIKTVDNRLTTVAAGKADTSALSTLQSTVNLQGTSLALRNCRFVTGSYTGTGKYGSATPNALTFTHKPVFLCIVSESNVMVARLIYDQPVAVVSSGSTTGKLTVTWGSKSVSWYVQEPIGTYVGSDCQMNSTGTYHYFAVLEL